MNKNSENKQKTAFQDGVAGGVFSSVIILCVVALALYLSPLGERIFTQEEGKEPMQVVGIDVADVVEEVNGAVVSIVISKDVPVYETYFDDPFGGWNPFNLQIPRYRQEGTERKEIGGGSGFLISEDGYVISNAHVVDDEEAMFTVFLDDGTSYDAEVIARDAILDLAVLKIEGSEFPYLAFGDSDQLRLGQGVIAIGNALGEFRNTVSTGVVSGLARTIFATNGSGTPEELENIIQTDAAINPGNSGGPLLNFAGQVIGVNVAVASGSENIGFSIPSNVVTSVVEMMIEEGRVIRPFLGVRYQLITPALVEELDLKVDQGAIIVGSDSAPAIVKDSPADKAGLQEGDIILKADGEEISKDQDLAKLLRTRSVGEEVKLVILRDGKEIEVTATLEEVP